MNDQWYVARNGQRHGPYGFESVRQFAAEGRLTPGDMVMNGAGQRWMSASAVSGLRFPSPPQTGLAAPEAAPAAQAPLSNAPAASAGNPDLARHSQWNRLREIARWQRTINAALLPYALLYYFALGAGPAAVSLCNSAAAIGLAWVSAKLAAALNLNAWLFGGLMFVPCVSALVLLFLMQRATRALKQAGIRAGLFGARLAATPPDSFTVAG